MAKARYNEIPKEYRRNYKKEALNFCGLVLTAMLFAALIVLVIVLS